MVNCHPTMLIIIEDRSPGLSRICTINVGSLTGNWVTELLLVNDAMILLSVIPMHANAISPIILGVDVTEMYG